MANIFFSQIDANLFDLAALYVSSFIHKSLLHPSLKPYPQDSDSALVHLVQNRAIR